VVGVDVVEVGHRETVFHNGVNIDLGLVEQGGYVLIFFHLVVTVFLPTVHCSSIPLNYHEIGIQQQNYVIFHLLFVQLHTNGLGGLVVERIGYKGWLYHRNAVLN